MTLTVARREFLIDRLEKTSAVMIREFLTYRQLDERTGRLA